MRHFVLVLILAAGIAQAQSGVPTFRADRIVPSNGGNPGWLVPGMYVTIYGSDLSPQPGCAAKADPRNLETPNPLRPKQPPVEMQIFPKEPCGVQVLIGDLPAGLLYVADKQINFKVPQEIAMQGTAALRVVSQGKSSAPVEMHLGFEPPTLSLEQPAHAGGPVWVQLQLPSFPNYGDVRYPFSIDPSDFGCNSVEARRGGQLLPRKPTHPSARMGGLTCGSISPGGTARKNVLPLHLQYQFDQPGTYEVRYTRTSGLHGGGYGPGQTGTNRDEILYQTAWTPIEILPGPPAPPPQPPAGAAELLSDYLPGILGVPDAAHLALITEYLYHPNSTVRQYAAQALSDWPDDEVNLRVAELLRTRGPSDAMIGRALHVPNAADLIIPKLQSQDATLLRAAVTTLYQMLAANPPVLSPEARSRAEAGLIAAEPNVLRDRDPQTAGSYACALGVVQDPRARELLWDLSTRDQFREQALIAITWRKNPADLPRLASLLVTPNQGDDKERTYASVPYAIHNAYGESAIPALEQAVRKSGYAFVQTNSARELVLAGRPAGFAFIAEAIEQRKFYSAEMVRFLQDRFPELKSAGEAGILAFLKSRQ
jgi:hypothetical protein